MRKRLYQALPENSELIDSVISACEEKKKKRLYADNIVKEHGGLVADTAERNASLAEMVALTELPLDMMYSLCDQYENEFSKIALTNYSGWYHSASTATKFLDCYMHIGNIAWEMGLAVACESAASSMQFILNPGDYR